VLNCMFLATVGYRYGTDKYLSSATMNDCLCRGRVAGRIRARRDDDGDGTKHASPQPSKPGAATPSRPRTRREQVHDWCLGASARSKLAAVLVPSPVFDMPASPAVV
jgi:hypothetical protein